jgi:hypothetical protein
MDLDPQSLPSTSTNVPGGSKKMPKEEVEGAIDDEVPDIGDDFNDTLLFFFSL